jgi:hypothetical protein
VVLVLVKDKVQNSSEVFHFCRTLGRTKIAFTLALSLAMAKVAPEKVAPALAKDKVYNS